jgi:hypothetical protein
VAAPSEVGVKMNVFSGGRGKENRERERERKGFPALNKSEIMKPNKSKFNKFD